MLARAILLIVAIAFLTGCIDSELLRSAFGTSPDTSSERAPGK